MPTWGHLFVELEPLLPVLICFQGVGIPHHHPGEIRVGKMRQVKRADSKTRKGRNKNYIDMLSCKLSQKSTEGANFRYLRCLICGWITWTITKGHTCQNYGAAACSSYVSPDGQSLNLGPSHIPRRARVSITFNRRQSAKKPTLPILFKPWWTWWRNAELVQAILDYHFGHHKCWEIPFRCWVIKHHEWQMWSIWSCYIAAIPHIKMTKTKNKYMCHHEHPTKKYHSSHTAYQGFEMRLLHRTAEKMIRSFSRPWNWSTEAILSHVPLGKCMEQMRETYKIQ